MLIKVTQQHIDQGEPGQACSCPIALAMQESGFDEPTVDVGEISCSDWQHYSPPDSVNNFVEAFDAGDPVEPFEFELDFDR